MGHTCRVGLLKGQEEDGVGRTGWFLFRIRNSCAANLRPPPRASISVNGPAYLKHNATNGKDVSVAFAGANWRDAERSTFDYWRWSQGDSEIEFFNPQPFPIRAEIHMVLRTLVVHKVTIVFGDIAIWSSDLPRSKGVKVVLDNLILKPGTNVMLFRTRGPLGFDAQQRPTDFGVWNAALSLEAGLQAPRH